MNKDAIPDTYHVSGYGRPATIQDGRIMPAAFKFRDNEDYISVNWLEYPMAPDWDSAINMIREALYRKNFSIKHNGKFVVLNVGDIKEIVHKFIGVVPKVEHLPTEYDASHAGIFRFNATDALIVLLIARLARNSSTYPGVVER